jgi:hypothetical protein
MPRISRTGASNVIAGALTVVGADPRPQSEVHAGGAGEPEAEGSGTSDPRCLIGLGGPDLEIAVVEVQIYDYYESAHRGANNSF